MPTFMDFSIMNQLLYWIWLSLACTAGEATFGKLYSKFSSAEAIYSADGADIASCIGSSSRDYNRLTDKSLEEAEKVLDFCTAKNVGILTYADERFPNSLRTIPSPPVLLYYRGVLPDFNDGFFISVVGTRRISDYGRKNAFTVARDMAKAGATVVSGMAIGIDGIALAAALSEGKTTVAVIGSGIDVCYPIQHKPLAREIVKNGCVFTEYAPGTPPDGKNFPVRNRIISGLSEATVVIEGHERSGALITARHAKAQGRIVYALPGNVGNRNSEATNLLIRNGARSFSTADDIIRDFMATTAAKLNPFKLLEPSLAKMSDVLGEYKVAAVAPNDSVFKPSGKARNSAPKEKINKSSTEQKAADTSSENTPTGAEDAVAGFDKKALELYKKIPASSECTIESLVGDGMTLRDVMRLLLKLEMARFVTMLPGEKVKRNIKF